MSLGDELLNSISENTETVESGNIIIGTDRFITVPESLKKIGVQYDHNIETVTFDCPRYWDGNDLSKMRVYVNYIRADGAIGSYLCDAATIDANNTDIMHFDWTISGNVTQVSGLLTFLVCIKMVDDEGNEANHWNSELNNDMYISAGLQCQEPIVFRHPDIISQLLLRADEIEYLLEVTEQEKILTEIREVRDTVSNLSEPDATLTKAGVAADAKTTGDRFATLTQTVTDNKTETDEALLELDETKANAADVYTKTEVDASLADRDETVSALSKTVTDNKTETDEALLELDSDISDLNESKANKTDVYAKEETLSPTTKTALGLGEDALPDDAFNALFDSAPKVGDTLTTLRTDLGEEWLLCNGDLFDKNVYPKLAVLRPTKTIQKQMTTSIQMTVYDVACYNGTWVAVGYDSSTYPYIFTTANPTGTWTIQQIDSSEQVIMRHISCYNGTWVALGFNTSNQPYIFTTTNPTSTWTKTRISDYALPVYDIAYYNGTWVAAGNNANAYPCILTTTNLTSTWTYTQITTSKISLLSVAYYNGTWVAAGLQNYKPYIYTATNPTGSWTGKLIYDTAWGFMDDIYCYNGTWVILGHDANGYPCILTTTDPTGTWIYKQISTTAIRPIKVICDNNTWMACGYTKASPYYPYVITTTNPTGTWKSNKLYTSKVMLRGIASDNGAWVTVGENNGSYPTAFAGGFYTLPTITQTDAYVYVKVKE